VWTAPALDAATLAAYQPAKLAAIGGYSIDDHPNLLIPGLRELFEAFRKEVLALDPCVTEEFMKQYVAYKAETNFVDVVPQIRRLRLSINMPFAEINDPKGLCRDITNISRWGNGDVDVGLKSLEELPYIMGLVRQAYERQMGDGGQP
jgi:predicted transport protein